MDKKIFIICAAVVIVSAISIIFGAYGYPVAANNDGAWFIVPAIRLATVGQLDNPINWSFTGIAPDPSGGHRFLSYPPLFEIFLSFFLFPSSSVPLPLQVFIVIGFVNAAVIALSAWALYMIATMNGKRLTWTAVVFISAALFLILRASWSFNGRPEVLLRLLFTIGVVLYLRMRRSPYLPMALGVCLGLAAAAHVLGPVFLSACILFAYAWDNDFRTSLRRIATTAVSAIAAFILVMQLSPYGIFETIAGILGVGTFALVRDVPNKSIFALFFHHPVLIFGAIIAAVAVIFAVYASWLKGKRTIAGSSILLMLAALVASVYVAFTFIDTRTYYLVPFIFLVPAALLYYVSQVPARDFLKYVLVFVFVLLVAFSFQKLILFPFFLRDGMSYYPARAAFADVIAKHPPLRIELGGSHLWALSDAFYYDKMLPGDALPQYRIPEYTLVREEGEAPAAPSTLGLCHLEDDFYTSAVPKIFGVKLASITPGYNFAVYDCHS